MSHTTSTTVHTIMNDHQYDDHNPTMTGRAVVDVGKGGGKQGGGGATSLLEKYATLNNAIHETRRQITNQQSQLSTIQSQIDTLRTKSTSISHQYQTNTQHTLPSIQKKSKQIETEYTHKQQRYRVSCQELQMVEKQWRDVQRKKEEERKEFLKDCNEFRRCIRRNRVCLESLRPFSSLLTSTTTTTTTTAATTPSIYSSGRDHGPRELLPFDEEEEEDHCTIHDDNSSMIGEEEEDEEDYDGYNTTERIAPKYDHYDHTDLTHNDAVSTTNNNEENVDVDTISSTEDASTSSNTGNVHSNCNRQTGTGSSGGDGGGEQEFRVSPIPNTLKKRKRRRGGRRGRGRRNHHCDHDNSTTNDDEFIHDEEIQQAKQIMDNTSTICTQTKENLHQIHIEKSTLTKRAKQRSKQLEQQRVQLEKVRADVQDMERQIASLVENTDECRQISEGYARGTCVVDCVCIFSFYDGL